jgi:hypothetical protein
MSSNAPWQGVLSALAKGAYRQAQGDVTMDAADIFRVVIAVVVAGAIGWFFWTLAMNNLK